MPNEISFVLMAFDCDVRLTSASKYVLLFLTSFNSCVSLAASALNGKMTVEGRLFTHLCLLKMMAVAVRAHLQQDGENLEASRWLFAVYGTTLLVYERVTDDRIPFAVTKLFSQPSAACRAHYNPV
jgi:hypothetical protein